MDKVLLNASDGASAIMYAHGAHIVSWTPVSGREQLFLSKTSELREGAAIRGGVPLIFPQFSGLGALPKHGFARNAIWQLLRNGQTESGAAQAVFSLQESAATLKVWPHMFKAELIVTVGGETMQIDLNIINSDNAELSFTSALHTYFAVEAIAEVQLCGLAGLRYRDMVANTEDNLENKPNLVINGEVDRIYADATAPIEIRQPHQTMLVSQTGFTDAVVWNPGAQKGASLSDLEPGGYQRMVCVEAGAILRPISLAPGAVWTGSQLLRVVQR